MSAPAPASSAAIASSELVDSPVLGRLPSGRVVGVGAGCVVGGTGGVVMSVTVVVGPAVVGGAGCVVVEPGWVVVGPAVEGGT